MRKKERNDVELFKELKIETCERISDLSQPLESEKRDKSYITGHYALLANGFTVNQYLSIKINRISQSRI